MNQQTNKSTKWWMNKLMNKLMIVVECMFNVECRNIN